MQLRLPVLAAPGGQVSFVFVLLLHRRAPSYALRACLLFFARAPETMSQAGSGLSDSARWPQRPTGALAAFSPRPPPRSPDDELLNHLPRPAATDVIGLIEPAEGGPGYWTTAEEDLLARFFVAHGLPLLAEPARVRQVVRSFQLAAGTGPWQLDLHTALTSFVAEDDGLESVRAANLLTDDEIVALKDGAASVDDGRPWAELLPGNAVQSSTAAFALDHTTRPPHVSCLQMETDPLDADRNLRTALDRLLQPLACAVVAQSSTSHTLDHTTRPPQLADSDASSMAALTLDHTTRPPPLADAVVGQGGERSHVWCAHVTVAATDDLSL